MQQQLDATSAAAAAGSSHWRRHGCKKVVEATSSRARRRAESSLACWHDPCECGARRHDYANHNDNNCCLPLDRRGHCRRRCLWRCRRGRHHGRRGSSAESNKQTNANELNESNGEEQEEEKVAAAANTGLQCNRRQQTRKVLFKGPQEDQRERPHGWRRGNEPEQQDRRPSYGEHLQAPLESNWTSKSQWKRDNWRAALRSPRLISRAGHGRHSSRARAAPKYTYATLASDSKRTRVRLHRGHRSTLVGLIEQFEQCVRVELDDTSGGDAATTGATITTQTINEHQPQEGRARVAAAPALPPPTTRMRDIVTPVNYEPEESTSSTTTSITTSASAASSEADGSFDCQCTGATRRDLPGSRWQAERDDDDGDVDGAAEPMKGLDSLEYYKCNNDLQSKKSRQRAACCCRRHERRLLASSPLERVAAKGIQVLPTTSGRRRGPSHGGSRSIDGRTTLASARHVDSRLQRKLTSPRWQQPTDGRQYEIRLLDEKRRLSNRNLSSENLHTFRHHAPSPAASQGPPIVKHKPTNSRQRLNQLARIQQHGLGGDSSATASRPQAATAGAAATTTRHYWPRNEIEEAIEQLELATSEWAEDEHLLDRAERRDWPAKYHELFVARQPAHHEEQQEQTSGWQGSHKESDATRPLLSVDFGRRLDVDPLEADSIAKSHANLALDAPSPNWPMGTSSSAQASATWSARRRPRPSAFADRYYDDLAVRRLSRSPSSAAGSMYRQQQQAAANAPIASYLLCSNAYTPSIEGQTSRFDAIERRLQADDLHYRLVKRKPVEPEPPFGVPKLAGGARAHLTAAQRLALDKPRKGAPDCQCDCHHRKQQQQQHLYQQQHSQQDTRAVPGGETQAQTTTSKRSATRASSAHKNLDAELQRLAGCVSADSGIVGGDSAGASPISPDVCQQSASSDRNMARSRAASHKPQQVRSPRPQSLGNRSPEVVNLETVDLDEEIGRLMLRDDQSDPLANVELAQAELRATPTKQRPKINIENPRSKSPLIRVSSSKEPKQQQQQQQVPQHDGRTKDQRQHRETVTIRCYEDTLERRSRLRSDSLPTSELECKYEFEDDGDEDDSRGRGEIEYDYYNIKTKTTRTTTSERKIITYESADLSPVEILSSPTKFVGEQEKVGAREQASATPSSETKIDTREAEKQATSTSKMHPPGDTMAKQKKALPNFTIGEYKWTTSHQNLKIL